MALWEVVQGKTSENSVLKGFFFRENEKNIANINYHRIPNVTASLRPPGNNGSPKVKTIFYLLLNLESNGSPESKGPPESSSPLKKSLKEKVSVVKPNADWAA